MIIYHLRKRVPWPFIYLFEIFTVEFTYNVDNEQEHNLMMLKEIETLL